MMQAQAGERPFPGLHIEQQDETETFVWSNRAVPKALPLYIVYGLTFGLLLLLVAYLTPAFGRDIIRLRSGYPLSTGSVVVTAVVVLLSWGGLLGVGYRLWSSSWVESIRISRYGITLHYEGRFSPAPRSIAEEDLWRISFEKLTSERDQEPRYTLNFFHADERTTVAYWLRKKERQQLYTLVAQRIQARGWNVDFKPEL